MDNNESSIILENNTNETAIKINEEENYIKNDTVVNNINDINKCENRKLETEDIDKLIHLDDELFLYHENSIKNDGDETILDYKNDDANENKNYIATSDDSYINISENSFKIIKNELKFKHKINVISEESEIEESENKNNDFSNEGSDEVSKNSLPIENDMNKITKENKISKELENESFNMNLNFSRDLENERNNNEIKYVNSPENESMLKHDFSNGSLTFFKRDNNISKEFNDNESYNFETTSMVDNKSINSIYSLNKELNDNPNDNQSIKTSNEAFIIQSIDFSRSKTNYSYNNDFDYTLNFERAKDYLQTYKEISDDENSKNFLLFKPFYTIANGVIAKQLNDNEQISDSSFYTSHAGYINVIKKKVTLDLIWNNNLTQVYFLMFLIHKDLKLAYIFLFYIDGDNFRMNYPYIGSLARKQQALKIYEDYFVTLSDSYIDWKYFMNNIPVNRLLKILKNQIDLGTGEMYSNFLFLAMLLMEKAFYGEDIFSNEVKKEKEKKNKNSTLNSPPIINSFENSVFYQEMVNDSIIGSYVSSQTNMKRAAERILNMSITYFSSAMLIKKISKFLVRIGVDKQTVSNSKIIQQIKNKAREGSIKQIIKHSRTQSDMLSIFGRNESGNSIKIDRTLSTNSARSINIKSGRGNVKECDDDTKSEIIPIQTSYNYHPEEKLTVDHVFVKYTDKKFSICEYCFDNKQISKKDLKSLYQCEKCNMIVHKCCRKLIKFDCVDNKKSIYDQYDGENEDEIIAKIKERIAAINTEIKLEKSIQEGAKKVIELSFNSSNNSSNQNSNILLEQSMNKVAVLTVELNNNRIYLEKFEAKLKEKHELIEKNKLEDSLSKEIFVEFNEGGKIIETKIKIQESNTTSEVIIMLLNNLKIKGLYNDYSLNYLSKNNNLIELMYSESPLKNVDYEKVKFILKNISKGNNRDNKYNFEKRLNVANEIHETEENYFQKLFQLRVFFIEPMIESKIFSQEDIEKIFVNIKQILELHKNMVKSLNDLWRKMDDVMELEEELVKIYTDNLPKISTEYCVYCSNRAIGDEYLLNLYNEDPKTKKFITECENNNKVALDKLTLKDLLIEPMHRITRYSILFKRLSGYINYPLHPINTFLSQIDEETKKVNTAVGEMDSKQKVIKLEKILEWNNVFYKFNIFCDKRKLYNIQEFQLIDKNGHNNEVVAYTFTDFILIVKMRKNIPILCIPPITYECCNIIDCFETAESDLDNIIKIIYNQHNVYILKAKSRTDKKNWLENIGLLKLSFCLSLYMSKNQPAILLKDDTGSITISDSSFESVASTTKKKFFSSLFEKSSGRRFSSVGTHSRKLSTASLDIDGKQKNMFLGKRFSVNIKRNSSFLSANEYIMNS